MAPAASQEVRLSACWGRQASAPGTMAQPACRFSETLNPRRACAPAATGWPPFSNATVVSSGDRMSGEPPQEGRSRRLSPDPAALNR